MAEKEYDEEWETMTKGDTKPDAAPAEKEDDPFEFARKEAGQNFDKPAEVPEEDKPAAAPDKPMSFKEAFASHRKAGAKVFEWNGKKYTTALKGEGAKTQAAAPAATAPAAKTAPVGGGSAVSAVSAAKPASMPAVATPVATKSVRGGSYAKGDPAYNKPATPVSPEKIEAATSQRADMDKKISNDFDNTPISKVFRAVGDAFTKPSSTVKSSSPMRG